MCDLTLSHHYLLCLKLRYGKSNDDKIVIENKEKKREDMEIKVIFT